ncbi:hypothetical protein [Caballeronia sp. BR00000012568055]|jgi:hypothetical protein|uniref:hypothetical protein n=1 Tax=Caballeronia sp. BR00000012568055 TaxID=2918761 RepID=UPI0023F62864|nr:hypothetical protein [Caballeronia sp. BR00000012568055]
MFVVYWLEAQRNARFERFEADALAQALSFAEALRKRQADGEDIGFITLCSENPQSVGRAGVADPPADYDWKKRRP